jgi:uncharacterized protein involved in exopolysaccharide biosynthesis
MSHAIPQTPNAVPDEADTVSLGELGLALARGWRRSVVAVAAGAAGGVALVLVLPPSFTARAVILPPKSETGHKPALPAALAALVGSDDDDNLGRYASIMKGSTIENAIVARFDLAGVYGSTTRDEARARLERNATIELGKDDLITIEVSDRDPRRAAAMAGAFVDGLRRTTAALAVAEAAQRRKSYEGLLATAQERLARAQAALQASGYGPGALSTRASETAQQYASLQAQAVAAEVRLETLRGALSDAAPSVQRAQGLVDALHEQLHRAESATGRPADASDYVDKQREFVLAQALAEQYRDEVESARADEARAGSPLQVIDPALAPDLPSWPRPGLLAIAGAVAGLFASWVLLLARFTRTS